jgi:hypothetical protein
MLTFFSVAWAVVVFIMSVAMLLVALALVIFLIELAREGVFLTRRRWREWSRRRRLGLR